MSLRDAAGSLANFELGYMLNKKAVKFLTFLLAVSFGVLTSCTNSPSNSNPVSPAATTGGAHANPETTLKKQTGGM
jgi:hypothetical protein